jgi:hypothetical protein
MSTFFRGITEIIPSLFRGIFSERNSVPNPSGDGGKSRDTVMADTHVNSNADFFPIDGVKGFVYVKTEEKISHVCALWPVQVSTQRILKKKHFQVNCLFLSLSHLV